MSLRGFGGQFFRRGRARGQNLSAGHKRTRGRDNRDDSNKDNAGGLQSYIGSNFGEANNDETLITNTKLNPDKLRLRLAQLQTEDLELDNNEQVVVLGNLRLDTAIATRKLADYNDPLLKEPVLLTIDEEEANAADQVLESIDDEHLLEADTTQA